MRVRYYGHSCFLLEIDEKKILIDPFIMGNPQVAGKINIDDMQFDVVLLTHGHEDHCLDAATIIKNNNALLVSNFEICNWFILRGINNTFPMNYGGTYQLEEIHIKAVNAVHSSSMPDGVYGGSPMGFLLWNKDKCIYIAGDTALTYDMKLIPEIAPILSAAILPIGDVFTMNYKDAFLAAEYVKCDKIIGCHYDTFPSIRINHLAAKEYYKNAGKELILLDVFDEIDI